MLGSNRNSSLSTANRNKCGNQNNCDIIRETRPYNPSPPPPPIPGTTSMMVLLSQVELNPVGDTFQDISYFSWSVNLLSGLIPTLVIDATVFITPVVFQLFNLTTNVPQFETTISQSGIRSYSMNPPTVDSRLVIRLRNSGPLFGVPASIYNVQLFFRSPPQ